MPEIGGLQETMDCDVKAADREATRKQKRLEVDERGLGDILCTELSEPIVAEWVWVCVPKRVRHGPATQCRRTETGASGSIQREREDTRLYLLPSRD